MHQAWRKVKKEERAKIAEEKPHLNKKELNAETVESTAAIIFESFWFLPYIYHTDMGDAELEEEYRCERDEARAGDFNAGQQADEIIFEAYGKLPLYRKREERALRAKRTPAPVPAPAPAPVYADIP